MMYKYIDEYRIEAAPKMVKINGADVFPPPAAWLAENGYKEFVRSAAPDDAPADKHYKMSYVDGETITQVWTLVDDDIPEQVQRRKDYLDNTDWIMAKGFESILSCTTIEELTAALRAVTTEYDAVIAERQTARAFVNAHENEAES